MKLSNQGGKNVWSISVMQTCSRSLNLADVLTRSDKQLSILACSPEPGPWLNSLVQSFCGCVCVGGEGCGKGAIKAASVHKRKICEKKIRVRNVPRGSSSTLWYSHCTPQHYSESPETEREEWLKVCHGQQDSQWFPPKPPKMQQETCKLPANPNSTKQTG